MRSRRRLEGLLLFQHNNGDDGDGGELAQSGIQPDVAVITGLGVRAGIQRDLLGEDPHYEFKTEFETEIRPIDTESAFIIFNSDDVLQFRNAFIIRG